MRLSSVTANPFSTFLTSTVFQNRFSEVSAPIGLTWSTRQLRIGRYARFVPVTAGPSWVVVCNQRANSGVRSPKCCSRAEHTEVRTVEKWVVNMKTCHDAISLGFERNPFRLMIGLAGRHCPKLTTRARCLNYNRSVPNTLVCRTNIGISCSTPCYQVGWKSLGNTCRTFKLILVVLMYLL